MPNAAGKRINTFAELIDGYPTLADLTSFAPPADTLDGVSLRPLFEDPDQSTIVIDLQVILYFFQGLSFITLKLLLPHSSAPPACRMLDSSG